MEVKAKLFLTLFEIRWLGEGEDTIIVDVEKVAVAPSGFDADYPADVLVEEAVMELTGICRQLPGAVFGIADYRGTLHYRVVGTAGGRGLDCYSGCLSGEIGRRYLDLVVTAGARGVVAVELLWRSTPYSKGPWKNCWHLSLPGNSLSLPGWDRNRQCTKGWLGSRFWNREFGFDERRRKMW